jgi:exodeoxyribonuclease-3
MQIATWNVNSLKVRLPQVLDWLAANPVELLCLQELKLSDDKFPFDALQAAGYEAAAFGQKTYNGVALLSRQPLHGVVRNIPGFNDPQARTIAATLPTPQGPLRIVNGYFVNGQAPGSDKFAYKLRWLAALHDWLRAELAQHPRLVCWATSTSRPKTATLTTLSACKAASTTRPRSGRIFRRCWRWA